MIIYSYDFSDRFFKFPNHEPSVPKTLLGLFNIRVLYLESLSSQAAITRSNWTNFFNCGLFPFSKWFPLTRQVLSIHLIPKNFHFCHSFCYWIFSSGSISSPEPGPYSQIGSWGLIGARPWWQFSTALWRWPLFQPSDISFASSSKTLGECQGRKRQWSWERGWRRSRLS